MPAGGGQVWWATPPDAYPNRRSDFFWALGYLSNWHLINTADSYFAAYTTASPLRHTWSLAIEEQFYLVWPTLVLLLSWTARVGIKRCPGMNRPVNRPLGRFVGHLSPEQRNRGLVALVAVLGIVASALWMANDYHPLTSSHAYYSTQGRVQELFVGVLLAATLPLLGQRVRRRALPALAWLGVVGLLAALYLMPDDAAIFYHGGALAVCLAAACVIAQVETRPQSHLARVISWRPAVALGRISYGVYLWHWPLVLMLPVAAGQSMREQMIRQGLRLAITLAASIASFVLVERPILASRRVLRSPSRVIVAALAASALVVAVTIPATALPGTLAAQVSHSSDRGCPGERIDYLPTCTWPHGVDVGQRPVRLEVLGDSTARALSAGLDDWANRTDSTWVEAAWQRCTSTGLLVVPNGSPAPDQPARICAAQASAQITRSLQTYQPPVVLVAEFWAHHQALMIDGQRVEAGTAEHDAALRSAYSSLVDQVASYGGRVVFLELPPPGDQLGEAVAAGRPAGHSRSPVSGNGRYVDGYNAVLRSVAAASPASASTVSLTDVLCPDEHCYPVQNGVLVRIDGVHYSIPYSRHLVPILMKRIGPITPIRH